MKKIVLVVAVILFGCYSTQAQTTRHKGNPENFDPINTNPVKTEAVQNFSDGFEGYTDFALNFSPWTLVDVDASPTYGFEGIDFPNTYAPMAFIIFNPALTTPSMSDNLGIQPHSGSKFAASFASETAPNNDWIISPQVELASNSSVSFWVKSFTADYGLERYRVGVSTGGTAPGDFTIISAGTYLEAPATGWQQKTFDLSQFDGQTIRVGINCVSNDAFIFMLDDFEITTEATQGSTLTGTVSDAFDGTPIAGATVSVAGLSAITDAYGNYTINNIPEGMLTADFAANVTSGEAPLNVNFFDYSSDGSHVVSCSKTGYSTYINNNVNIPPNGSLTLNISLTTNLAAGQMRFVLNWGANPRDLDSHLNTPEIEGNTYHVYYSYKGNANAAPYAALDYDYTNGYGPETMTIYDFYSGTYQYYIYKFAGTGEITTSQAVIQIYNDAGLMQTLQAPTSGTGDYWYVCDINGSTSQLTIKNVIQENEPGSGKGSVYPPKTKDDAKNVTSWNWNFGDGTTSSQQNPSHVFTTAGTYTVSLTIGNGTTTATETKTAYINVSGAAGTGSLSGMVSNALNGEPIEGALVSVAGLSDITDAAGNYLIENVPVGQLTANFNANPSSGQSPLSVNFFDQSTENSNTVTCSKTDYNTYSNNQVVIPANGHLTLNISLSPNLAAGQMRFVLNWGASPTDLDSHLLTPVIEGQEHHIAWYNRGSETSAPFAALDYDYIDGYGPETTTIYDFYAGTYKFFIDNYSESPAITTSQAVVQIYGQSGLLNTLQVPTNGSGLIWYVCDIDGSTGQVTIRNTIQQNEPGSNAKISYPAKERDSKSILSWQWNFGDGNTSTAQNPTHVYNTNGSYTVSLSVTDNAGNSSTETKTAFIQVGGQGIEEQQQVALKIFPQPAESQINLECAETIEGVMITDLSGKTLMHKTYGTKKIVLNVDHLKNGVYLLVVITEKANIVRKITMR